MVWGITDSSAATTSKVWLDVFRTLSKLRSPNAFRVWLYRIAHNRVATYVRRQILESDAREQLAVDTSEAEQHWNELDVLENAELIHFALTKLSPVHRQTMMLRFLEEMDVKEIARVMGCSEGTSKSRLYYAKQAMRRIISEERDDD